MHCDSFPPAHFDRFINDTVQKGNLAACFRLKFDYKHPILMILQWFTRFNHISFRGGDQSLFVTKKLFKEIKGFDEQFIIYEDNEIISKLYAKKQFVVIPDYIVTSARRYQQNGVWRLQYHFSMLHLNPTCSNYPVKYCFETDSCLRISSLGTTNFFLAKGYFFIV